MMMAQYHCSTLWEESSERASVTAPTVTPNMKCCCSVFPRIVIQWEGFAVWKTNKDIAHHVITLFSVG